MDGFRPRLGVPEALYHSTIPPLAFQPRSLINPPRVHPFATRIRLPQGLNGQQEQQTSSGQFMQARAADMAQVNTQSFQAGFGSGPGARGQFTRALDAALVESGFPPAHAPLQYVHPHRYQPPYYASVRNPMENRPTDLQDEIRMRDLARRYVQEGRVLHLSAIETLRFADQDLQCVSKVCNSRLILPSRARTLFTQEFSQLETSMGARDCNVEAFLRHSTGQHFR